MDQWTSSNKSIPAKASPWTPWPGRSTRSCKVGGPRRISNGSSSACIKRGKRSRKSPEPAAAMRRHMTPIRTSRKNVMDVVGTGGDASGTFQHQHGRLHRHGCPRGVPIAKHGNRRFHEHDRFGRRACGTGREYRGGRRMRRDMYRRVGTLLLLRAADAPGDAACGPGSQTAFASDHFQYPGPVGQPGGGTAGPVGSRTRFTPAGSWPRR